MLALASAHDSHDREMQLDDPDMGRSVFERLYQVPRIDIRRGPEKQFSWKWRISPRGTATIISGHARAGQATLAGSPPHLVLALASTGSVDMSTAGQRFTVLPGRSAGIVNAGLETAVVTDAGTRTLNIRIEPGALASHAAALIGAPVSTAPRFDSFLDLRSDAGADILRLVQFLEDGCTRPDSPLGSPHVLAHLREALYSALLVGHRSTLYNLLRKPAPAVNTRAVRQAEEILAARAAEPISIAEVAELMGIGLRSLERSFKAARGCSLRDFLKAQRLELAHRRLRAAAPGATVTQVLHASGFSHPGEFSLAYRKRFGEAPSATLRQATGEGLSRSDSRGVVSRISAPR